MKSIKHKNYYRSLINCYHSKIKYNKRINLNHKYNWYKTNLQSANLLIKSRKEIKENGESHYAELDTWRPNVPTVPVVSKSTIKKTTAKKSEPAKLEEPAKSEPVPISDDNNF